MLFDIDNNDEINLSIDLSMDHKRVLNDRLRDRQLSNRIIISSCDEDIPNIYKSSTNENLIFEMKINKSSNHLKIERIQIEEKSYRISPMLEDIQQMNVDDEMKNDVKQKNKSNFQLNRSNR